MQPNPPRASRWNLWPLSIGVFFTVAIIGCGSFIAFCSRHQADLVAPDYYEQEVRYQHQLDCTRRANQQAQLTSIRYDPARRIIRISLPSQAAGPGASGDVQLYRPSSQALDRRFKLRLDPSGSQAIDATPLAPGLWRVRVAWQARGEDYLVDKRVIVGGKGT